MCKSAREGYRKDEGEGEAPIILILRTFDNLPTVTHIPLGIL